MSALTDIQRALNIIRKVVDAQHKNIGLDALVLLNQTAASVSTLLKDKPSTSNKLERPTPLPIPKPNKPSVKSQDAPSNKPVKVANTDIITTIKPQPPVSIKPLT
jgi:hypothetical protein